MICVALVASGACKQSGEDGSEQRYVQGELAELEAALAARAETKVTVDCASLSASVARMPSAIAGKIARLCYVEAPRLYLENAVADVTEKLRDLPSGAGSRDQHDIICMQLMVSDAFETLAQHPSTDPGLQKLVDEYTRLCPERAAELRGK